MTFDCDFSPKIIPTFDSFISTSDSSMHMREISKKIKLLGGEIEIILFDIDALISDDVFYDIEKEAIRLQKIFNFFDRNSELSKLNQRREAKASKELQKVIKLCLPYCKLTEGAFDITLGKQIIQRKKGERITKVSCSYKDIKIKKDIICLNHKDVLLDLGAAAKGFIGDMLAKELKKMGVKNAFIDLRGDLIMFGNHKERIVVQHPRKKEETIFEFTVKNKAVATSGDYSQYYGTFENSHILGSKDIISATVIADSLAIADILATCIFVSGTKKLNRFKDESYFVIDDKIKKHISEGFLNEAA